MLNLKIIFERTVNRGFPDEPDKVVVSKKTGKERLEKGSKGEHVQIWACGLVDRQGWPVISLSREYFQRKITAEGCKPIRIEGQGAIPSAWTPEMVQRVQETLGFIRPLVEANERLAEAERRVREYEQAAESRSLKQGKGKSNQESAQTLPSEGGSATF